MAKIGLPEDIVERVAQQHQLPTHVVERIVRHQFNFVKQCMVDEVAIRLHKLGVFTPKKLYNGTGNRTNSDS